MTCKHEATDTTADGERTYCTDCGMRMVAEPGAAYYRALEDSRRLKWHKVGEAGYVVELDKVYIGAGWNPTSRIWTFRRVRWSEALNGFEIVQEDLGPSEAVGLRANPLYIASDDLGVPCAMPVGNGSLSSQAA